MYATEQTNWYFLAITIRGRFNRLETFVDAVKANNPTNAYKAARKNWYCARLRLLAVKPVFKSCAFAD